MKDIDMSSINSAYAAMEAWREMDVTRECERVRDEAIFDVARVSKEQVELLAEQVNVLKDQNKLLKEMYEEAKADAEENKNQAKHNKIFGWVSFAVGTAIGIAGVLVGILL
jgi:hypothetical protein